MTEIQNTDETYMREALKQAKKALALGEVPIGCVIVHEGKIIARGYNRRNTDQSTLSHAEITAIRKAGKVLKDWRLEGCTLYVTLEPCQMCAGAIVQARIPRVVMGSMNPKAGCAGSIINLLEMKTFNHQVEVTRDVLREECSAILQTFFSEMREKQRAKRAPGTLIRSLRGGLPGYTIVEGSEENAEDIQKLMAGNEEYFRLVKKNFPPWKAPEKAIRSCRRTQAASRKSSPFFIRRENVRQSSILSRATRKNLSVSSACSCWPRTARAKASERKCSAISVRPPRRLALKNSVWAAMPPTNLAASSGKNRAFSLQKSRKKTDRNCWCWNLH